MNTRNSEAEPREDPRLRVTTGAGYQRTKGASADIAVSHRQGCAVDCTRNQLAVIERHSRFSRSIGFSLSVPPVPAAGSLEQAKRGVALREDREVAERKAKPLKGLIDRSIPIKALVLTGLATSGRRLGRSLIRKTLHR